MLLDQLQKLGYPKDEQRVLPFTIATDGLKFDSSKVMAISIPDPVKSTKNVTIYIDGADVTAVEEYTGVSPEYYRSCAVGIPRAIELITPVLFQTEVIVTYSAHRYTKIWLETLLAEQEGTLIRNYQGKAIVWLDVQEITKFIDARKPFPLVTETSTLLTFSNWIVKEFRSHKGGYAFEELIRRADIDVSAYSKLPLLEQKLPKLRLYWVYLLKTQTI